MVQLVWTERALTQFERIRDTISADSLRYTERFCTRLVAATAKLADWPRCGAVVSEFDDDSVRELPFFPYRILYKLQEDKCYIVTIIHGRRDLFRHEQPEKWDV